MKEWYWLNKYEWKYFDFNNSSHQYQLLWSSTDFTSIGCSKIHCLDSRYDYTHHGLAGIYGRLRASNQNCLTQSCLSLWFRCRTRGSDFESLQSGFLFRKLGSILRWWSFLSRLFDFHVLTQDFDHPQYDFLGRLFYFASPKLDYFSLKSCCPSQWLSFFCPKFGYHTQKSYFLSPRSSLHRLKSNCLFPLSHFSTPELDCTLLQWNFIFLE